MRNTVAALLARRRRWAVGAELVGYVDLADTDFGAAETFLVYSSPVAGPAVSSAVLLARYLDAHTEAWNVSGSSPLDDYRDRWERARERDGWTDQQRRERDDRVFAAVLAEADAAAALIRYLSEGGPAPRPWRVRNWTRRARRVRRICWVSWVRGVLGCCRGWRGGEPDARECGDDELHAPF